MSKYRVGIQIVGARKPAGHDEAVQRLKKLLPNGSIVWTVVMNTARSGMQRTIKLLAVDKDGIVEISGDAAKALGRTFDDNRGGVKVRGTGMDMSLEVVYSLSQVLYGDGFSLVRRSL